MEGTGKVSGDATGMFVSQLTEAQWAWTIFDAGSFGFYTATFNTIVPMWLYNSATWYGGMTSAEATAAWSYAVTFTTVLTSVLSPLTGWIADKYSLRRAATALFVLLSPIFLLAASIVENNMHLRIFLVSLGYSCYNLHFTFFFSLLPSVCNDSERDSGSKAHQLSILSTALSNVGAGFLLLGVIAFERYAQGGGPAITPITTQRGHLNTELLFALCASWWWVIAMPLVLSDVKEPLSSSARSNNDEGDESRRLLVTTKSKMTDEEEEIEATKTHDDAPLTCLQSIRKRRNMWVFLAGNYFVNEGSSVIYQMTALFAVSAMHLRRDTVLQSTVLNRFVAGPITMIWFALHNRAKYSPLRLYLAAVFATAIVGIGCMWLALEWQFYVLQILLAWGGTGTFAFGRSIMSDLVDPEESGLAFGLYTIVSRTAGALGPLAFGFVVQQSGSPRAGFLVVVVFLSIGCVLLSLVEESSPAAKPTVHARPAAKSDDVRAAPVS
eukprot:g1295.t1